MNHSFPDIFVYDQASSNDLIFQVQCRNLSQETYPHSKGNTTVTYWVSGQKNMGKFMGKVSIHGKCLNWYTNSFCA